MHDTRNRDRAVIVTSRRVRDLFASTASSPPLEREQLADAQALPYLALLVTTIFADAEKTFGKDKAKKGYKAAQKSVMLGDASALSSPELTGKLPRV